MRRRRAAGVVPAVAAAGVFVGVFLTEDALRPHWDPASMFVSELSLGPYGWVQRASFAVSGVLLFLGARVVGSSARAPRRSRTLRATLRVMGVGLAGSAVFDTDPSVLFAQRSVAGVVHGLLGAVVFLGMPLSCALVAAGAGAARPVVRGSSWAIAGLLLAGIAVLKVVEVSGPPFDEVEGLIQRAVLVVWFGWLVVFAAARPAPEPARTRLR